MDRNIVGVRLIRREHIPSFMGKVKLPGTVPKERRFREAVLALLLCFTKLAGFSISPVEQVTP